MSNFTTRYRKDYKISDFTIKTIDLTVELDDTKTQVHSKLTIVKQGEHSNPLVLDGENMTLLAVSLNGETLSASQYQLTDSNLIIATQQTEFELEITTEINPKDNTALEGLFKSGEAFCTQCEAEGFRRITYYLDRPDVMAVFTCKIIADKTLYPFLLSNGNKVESGDLANNQHFVTWHDPYPKPCYLFALVAGDFDLLEDQYQTSEGRDVALQIFVDKGNLHKAHHAMASLKKAMKWDEDTFGLAYDLDIYMIVAVDFFNMGAMENKGLNVFNSKYVLADTETATDTDYFNIESVIAHEYFHNWTGNRVTCRDWFQLSLKEGLTVFRDQQFSADHHSASVCRIQNVRLLRAQQFAEDAGPMAHPIRPDKVMEMNNFYTLTVYEKGAEVIRMIHTLLGKENFRKGMDLYFQRFDGMAVTCDDFVNAMADASGVNLTIFKRWYSQSGTPVVEVETQFDEKAQKLTLTLTQINAPTEVQPIKQALHIPFAVELIDVESGNSSAHLLELTQESQQFEFNQITTAPVIAPLANFSAPVKLKLAQTETELQQIMKYAKDDFCRWDATQNLLKRYIKQSVEDASFEIPSSLTQIFANILTSNANKAFIAEQLTLPSFDELMAEFEQVDPLAVVNARQRLADFIANQLHEELTTCYQQNTQFAGLSEAEAVAQRQLKNMCLSYIAKHPDSAEIIEQQYQTSDNMTDSLAALEAAKKGNVALFDTLMQQFEQKWYNTTLVMDKWFMLAASVESDDIFQRLDKLLSHPLLSMKNPNRARSLIAAFSMNNPKHFHAESGAGYQFLAKRIEQLNDINPQVASRLITPLIQFERYDEKRQQMIKALLKQLQSIENLSRDLSEKLSAALKN